jgi:uncharacterized protein (TIGR03435 family)
MLACGALVRAQSQARATFEVASVTPSPPATGAMGVFSGMREGDRWRAANATLRLLIQSGYGGEFPMTGQIIGGPEWMDTERFDVTASIPQGTAGSDLAGMVRSLLADRFGLRVHREERELPVYLLRVSRGDGKLGPKIRALAIDCDALRAARLRGDAPPMAPPTRDRPVPDCFTGIGPGRLGYNIASGGISMADLASSLSAASGRPVFDRTGLKGFFALDLTFATEPGAVSPLGGRSPGVAIEQVDLPSLSAAVEEQLGLKLESRREAVKVLVIDGADRPTAN